MIHPNPEFMLDQEAFVVGFSGGGGACEGIDEHLGRNVDVAINHAKKAIAMHRMNHPDTIHYTTNIWDVDPLEVLARLGYRRIGGAWFSPDCKHFSKAKGAALIDRAVRSLAWVLKMWARRGGGRKGRGPACPRVMYGENVEEFETWGPLIAKRCPKTGRVVRVDGTVANPGERVPYYEQAKVPDPKRKGLYFRRLMADLREVGGKPEWRSLRASVYGVPTIRKRLYMVIPFEGTPVVWPEESHADIDDPAVKDGEKEAVVPIANCLEFDLPCPSIFLSKEAARKVNAIRPLVENTEERIAKGVDRYVLKTAEPYIVCLTHRGIDGAESIHAPSKTVTAANRGERALISPVVAHAQQGGRTRSAGKASHTITASPKDQNQLLSVSLTKFNTGSVGQSVREAGPTVTANSYLKRPGGCVPMGVIASSMVKLSGSPANHPPGHPVTEPGHTIRAGGEHHAHVAAFMAQHNTGVIGHASTEPASTISSKGCQQALVGVSVSAYYGSEDDSACVSSSARTVTTKDRFGLIVPFAALPPFTEDMIPAARRVAAFLRRYGVEFEGEFATVTVQGVELVLIDIGMRMLIPRELYRIQGFPDSYVIDRGLDVDEEGRAFEIPLTRTDQVRMVGNSVCPPMAKLLVAANNPEMRISKRKAA